MQQIRVVCSDLAMNLLLLSNSWALGEETMRWLAMIGHSVAISLGVLLHQGEPVHVLKVVGLSRHGWYCLLSSFVLEGGIKASMGASSPGACPFSLTSQQGQHGRHCSLV